MQFQEQEEFVQIALLQIVAAIGAYCKGQNAELLVLVLLLGRIGDPNASMTALADELLLGRTTSQSLAASHCGYIQAQPHHTSWVQGI